MRIPIAAAVLLSSLTLAACGGDELQRFEDTANDAIEDVRSGATAEELEQRLDQVRTDLEDSDLPDDARRELESARDQLEEALR